ncbi:MAG: ATP-dependent DNA helicase RecG [Pirellulaceae bacterium]
MAATHTLQESVQFLPGVGEPRAQLLSRLGIRRAVDLLFFFPRGYEDAVPLQTVDAFSENVRVSFAGTILEIDERVTQSGKHMLGAQTRPDSGGSVRLLWFNQPFRKNDLRIGMRVLATGVLRSTVLNWEMVQPQIKILVGDEDVESQRPMPIYPLTEGIKQPAMRAMMRQALPELIEQVEEALPPEMQTRLSVPDVVTALRDMHFPGSLEDAMAALRRFKLQELLVLQLAIALQRQGREQGGLAPVCEPSGKIHARILNRLPHQLTPDQVKAIDEIGGDMARVRPMNRLLQGDVGSGKTLVAQYAMLLCVAHGYQAALMAPTEVLARQHASTLAKSLGASRVRIGLLTGNMPARARRDLLEQVAAGEVDLVVGTQALLSADMGFNKLALVIVDEQHKFGVMQRAKLRTEETQPHYLVLSATPIPRTIAMTAFGDLDVSTIRTKPPGRAPVHTYTATRDNLTSWWKFFDEQLQLGRQAYVIAPRVAETEKSDAVSAEGLYAELTSGVLAHRRLGLLHGRLSGDEKEAVLAQFAGGQLDVLVATTVVEVGIDVPNATVMAILDADRLGLSQLHQLRGRISRGRHPGFVCAIASIGSQAVDNERLKAFQKSDDGFELAEMDLKMRGPGDLLGTSQSGLPTLRIANLIEDADLLIQARNVAREILVEDPSLSNPKLSRLVQQTLRRYGKSMQLSDVG